MQVGPFFDIKNYILRVLKNHIPMIEMIIIIDDRRDDDVNFDDNYKRITKKHTNNTTLKSKWFKGAKIWAQVDSPPHSR